MRNQSPTVGVATINGTLACESENRPDPIPATVTLGSESNPHEWFYEAAHRLLGKDAGLHLHYLTGYPQSSCYAYVARNERQRRRPPEHFLRVLFRRPEGREFHAAFMAGCAWWIELQADADYGRRVLALER